MMRRVSRICAGSTRRWRAVGDALAHVINLELTTGFAMAKSDSTVPGSRRPLAGPRESAAFSAFTSQILQYLSVVATHGVLGHPVRMRIVLALVGDRELTTADLVEELPDVPPATLYRHISALIDAKVLDVASERRVRGAVERTYRLRSEFQLSSAMTLADRASASQLSDQELRASFGIFAASLIAAYDDYLAREARDIVSDPVGYRAGAVYASEDDVATMRRFAQETADALQSPSEGKRRILFGILTIPL